MNGIIGCPPQEANRPASVVPEARPALAVKKQQHRDRCRREHAKHDDRINITRPRVARPRPQKAHRNPPQLSTKLPRVCPLRRGITDCGFPTAMYGGDPRAANCDGTRKQNAHERGCAASKPPEPAILPRAFAGCTNPAASSTLRRRARCASTRAHGSVTSVPPYHIGISVQYRKPFRSPRGVERRISGNGGVVQLGLGARWRRRP